MFSFISNRQDERSRSRERSKERSRSLTRSLSPFRSRSKQRDESVERLGASDAESEYETDADEAVVPSNAFDSEESSSEDELEEEALGEMDEQLEKNTMLNASKNTPMDFLAAIEEVPGSCDAGEGPNIVTNADLTAPIEQMAITLMQNPRRKQSTRRAAGGTLEMTRSQPVYRKNRCTLTVTQGTPEAAAAGRTTRLYLVASDLSTESLYAIQWAIGTVLRQGDECIMVSVIETDSKFDAEGTESKSEMRARLANEKDRLHNAQSLSRQAMTFLQRTQLNVRIHCQAIHAKNARHMLVDMIDYFGPTLVIVGSRGVSMKKSLLLGSVSNYLIQKSASPVMVTRRPLKLSRQSYKPISALNREQHVSLSQATIEKESTNKYEAPVETPDE